MLEPFTDKIIQNAYWHPMIKVTNMEYGLSKSWNELLDTLRDGKEEDVKPTLDTMKLLLMNLALDLNIEL